MAASSPGNDTNKPVFFIRRTPAAPEDTNIFDSLWQRFESLVTGPDPVAVDGREIPGLPPRDLPVNELGTLLLDPGCSQATRDAAWRHLITRSRAEGGAWTVACTGLALPVLLPVARSVTWDYAGDREDLYAAILTGFLDGVSSVDLDRPAILVRLRWTAYRAGKRAVREAFASPTPQDELGLQSTRSSRPDGHPDLVLAAASTAGVITDAEAGLISATRLGELSLADAAHARGQSYEATKRARLRAEARLLAHLAHHDRDSPEPARAAAENTANRHAPKAARPSPSGQDTAGVRPRQQLPTVTGTKVGDAGQTRHPMSPTGPKSRVSRRGTRLPADPARRTRRAATRPDVPRTREVRSCD